MNEKEVVITIKMKSLKKYFFIYVTLELLLSRDIRNPFVRKYRHELSCIAKNLLTRHSTLRLMKIHLFVVHI